MHIGYFEPLSRAWERMKVILFGPFDLGKWLVLGFSAWLAGLADGSNSALWTKVRGNDFPVRHRFDTTGAALRDAGEALIWLPLIFLILLVVIAVVVLVLWLSSRAKFIFLDNLVHDRAQIADPWHRFERLGNSLFLWRLGFTVVCILIVLVILFILVAPAATLSVSDALGGLSYAGMFFGILALVVFGVMAAYVALFLEAFVIPIMYKFDLKATEAWTYVMTWFRARPLHFVLYGLFVLLLWFAFAIIVMIACLLTCCVVVLPYVGTVILLPFWVTYRLFSVEFLRQFDPGFDVFTPAELPA